MTNKYLLFPLEPLNDLSIIDISILSQLAYMKKAFNELYPSNAFLSSLFKISLSSVKRSITKLIQFNYITTVIKNRNKRIITLSKKSLRLYGLLYTQNNKKFNKGENIEALRTFWKEVGLL